MPKTRKASNILMKTARATSLLAILCSPIAAPPIFAQAPIFVLPSLDSTPTPTPAAHPATSPSPAPAAPRPANNALPAVSTTTQPSSPSTTTRPANNAVPAPTTARPSALPATRPTNNALSTPTTPRPSAPATPHPTSDAANAQTGPKHHPQPEDTSALGICHKRYADSIYTIGLALWTAPPLQHRALERLLNAAVAAQTVALDPETTTEKVATFCADATLKDLEATVVRLKDKGWVPMTDDEAHVVHTTNVGDELKHAIDGISK